MTEQREVEKIGGFDGILVAPGFGERGIEGKIETVRYVREHNIPFFGICLGMQMAVIEYARTVLGFEDANSTEMNSQTSHPVIDLMEEQKTITDKGGTMRLGSWKCNLEKDSLAYQIYGKDQIEERHRHRFEFNGQLYQISVSAKLAQQPHLYLQVTPSQYGLSVQVVNQTHPAEMLATSHKVSINQNKIYIAGEKYKLPNELSHLAKIENNSRLALGAQ